MVFRTPFKSRRRLRSDRMSRTEQGGFPWYLKAVIAVAVLVVLAILVIDLLELAASL